MGELGRLLGQRYEDSAPRDLDRVARVPTTPLGDAPQLSCLDDMLGIEVGVLEATLEQHAGIRSSAPKPQTGNVVNPRPSTQLVCVSVQGGAGDDRGPGRVREQARLLDHLAGTASGLTVHLSSPSTSTQSGS